VPSIKRQVLRAEPLRTATHCAQSHCNYAAD